jgi:hypothetical protein
VWRHTLATYAIVSTLLPSRHSIAIANVPKRAWRPVVARLTVSRSGFTITAGHPVAYNSSAKAIRFFCGRCGTPLTWHAIDNPGLIDVGIAKLDDPAAVEPTLHIWTESRIAWFETADHLVRHRKFVGFRLSALTAARGPRR